MDREQFVREMAEYSLNDLLIIRQTQKDVYSAEEMQLIEKIIAYKQKKQPELPVPENPHSSRMLPAALLLSLLLAPFGFLLGAMLLANPKEENRALGKKCIVAGFVSLMLCMFIMSVVTRI